jgi:hypothetical protein
MTVLVCGYSIKELARQLKNKSIRNLYMAENSSLEENPQISKTVLVKEF